MVVNTFVVVCELLQTSYSLLITVGCKKKYHQLYMFTFLLLIILMIIYIYIYYCIVAGHLNLDVRNSRSTLLRASSLDSSCILFKPDLLEYDLLLVKP